jgi:chromosome partitioning protein
MATVISFANQKGGVAKTTSTFNVATSLAARGYRVLMIDLDSQASLTISAGLEPFEYDNTIVTVLKRERNDIREAIVSLALGLDIIPSRLELAQLEMELIGRSMRETILRRALAPVRGEYDYILIDCPPQLAILTINALACSDRVIVPVKTDYLAYRGVELLMETIDGIKTLINSDLEVMGIIATMYEKRVNDDKEILAMLQEKYNVIGVVKKSAVAKKGVYDGLSVAQSAPKTEVGAEYNNIAEYIINKGV